jgi:TonB family protein
VSFVKLRPWVVSLALLAAASGGTVVCPMRALAQQQEVKGEVLTRKPKTKVMPTYPEIARRMNITGTVRLAVVVSPNGTVKSSKPVGGHPVLVNAALDAMKQWKFEPAPTDSSGIVEFKFQPQE